MYELAHPNSQEKQPLPTTFNNSPQLVSSPLAKYLSAVAQQALRIVPELPLAITLDQELDMTSHLEISGQNIFEDESLFMWYHAYASLRQNTLLYEQSNSRWGTYGYTLLALLKRDDLKETALEIVTGSRAIRLTIITNPSPEKGALLSCYNPQQEIDMLRELRARTESITITPDHKVHYVRPSGNKNIYLSFEKGASVPWVYDMSIALISPVIAATKRSLEEQGYDASSSLILGDES